MPKKLGFAWISKKAFQFLLCEAERAYPNETGGVFIGYWSTNSRDVVIVHVVGPGPGAVHSPKHFHPDSDYHMVQVAKHYEKSGRIHTYLGDWHTHPEGNADLSWSDRETLKKIASDKQSRAPTPIMGIMSGGDWSLQVWQYLPPRWRRLRGASTRALGLKIY